MRQRFSAVACYKDSYVLLLGASDVTQAERGTSCLVVTRHVTSQRQQHKNKPVPAGKYNCKNTLSTGRKREAQPRNVICFPTVVLLDSFETNRTSRRCIIHSFTLKTLHS